MKKLLGQKIYLSLVGVFVILVVFASYLITAQLDTPLNPNDTKRLKVQLASTGGLFKGSAVTYRGVKIGKVSDLNLGDDGVVEADIALVTEMDIPTNSRIKVRSLSPVGEQYLDFQPTAQEGPYFESGDVVKYPLECLPVARALELGQVPDAALRQKCYPEPTAENPDPRGLVRVSTPETLSSTVVNIKSVLDQIDPALVKTSLSEVATGLENTSEGIGRMVDQGDRILGTIEANWPMIQRLLRNGNTVLKIAPSLEQEIIATSTSLQQFAQFLREFDPTARQLLDGAPAQFKQVEGLLDDFNKTFPRLLDRSIALNTILAARDPHLRELLAQYAPTINKLGTIAHAGGPGGKELQFELYMTEQQICSYNNTRRAPTTAGQPMQTEGRCSAGLPFLQRGAAHAPPPGS